VEGQAITAATASTKWNKIRNCVWRMRKSNPIDCCLATPGTVRYLGIEIDHAIEIAEKIDL
jgi:hypothetical protein